MSKKRKFFSLQYGIPISKQLNQQGFWFDPEIVEGFELSIRSLMHLLDNEVITTNVYNRSLSRVFDQVLEHVTYIHNSPNETT